MNQTQLTAEYSKWLASLQAAGFKFITVRCEDCGGTGDSECEHCGSAIECPTCGGSGKRSFPNFQDYLNIREVESNLAELWKSGKPIHIEKGLYGGALLPWFLVGGQMDDPAQEDRQHRVEKIVISIEAGAQS